jgi:hypothetical protein
VLWGPPGGPVIRPSEKRETRRRNVAHYGDLPRSTFGGGLILAHAWVVEIAAYDGVMI